MKRFALVALLITTAAGGAAQANATKGWHRCQHQASLCDGRGRVLFPLLSESSSAGGYTQAVTGFHRSSGRRGFVDTFVDWGRIQGECGQTGYIKDCKDWVGHMHVRYQTSDGGRRWRPTRFHREVTKAESPGPDPPVQTGHIDDHPPLTPCKWSHAEEYELVRGLGWDGDGLQFGNWCAPVDEWWIPDSLWP